MSSWELTATGILPHVSHCLPSSSTHNTSLCLLPLHWPRNHSFVLNHHVYPFTCPGQRKESCIWVLLLFSTLYEYAMYYMSQSFSIVMLSSISQKIPRIHSPSDENLNVPILRLLWIKFFWTCFWWTYVLISLENIPRSES